MQLTPQLLLNAYCQGFFPMAHDEEIYWYDPDPRAILPLDEFHVSRSLQRTMKRVWVREPMTDILTPFAPEKALRKSDKRPFEVRINYDFDAMIRACADPSRKGSWIDDQIIDAYSELHQLGWAHSVETWQDGRLVGGLYGVGIRGLFAGEAMFSHVSEASKVALVVLVERMKRHRLSLLDVQFQNDHLTQFGVVEIASDEYKQLLQGALVQEVDLIEEIADGVRE